MHLLAAIYELSGRPVLDAEKIGFRIFEVKGDQIAWLGRLVRPHW
jgi:hypothetical protein